MMTIPESTSAEAFDQYVPGRLMAASNGWKNLLVRIYSEPSVEERVMLSRGGRAAHGTDSLWSRRGRRTRTWRTLAQDPRPSGRFFPDYIPIAL